MKHLNYLAKFTICCLALFIFDSYEAAYAKCPGETLKDMLDFENPRIIKRLAEIEKHGKGYREAGIILCDESKILANRVFKQAIHPPCTGQHIFFFEEEHVLKAVIWIEPNGRAIRVPPCPKNDCSNIEEAASVLSGDVYTSIEVQPGDGIVLLQYPTKEWVEELKNQTNQCQKSR